jgi:hypothetical protein
MRFPTFIVTVAAGVLLLARCGGSSPGTKTPTATAAPTPSAAVASTPSTSPSGGVPTGGYGDTAANPDATYACGYEEDAEDNVTVLAIITVAGSSSADTEALTPSPSPSPSATAT